MEVFVLVTLAVVVLAVIFRKRKNRSYNGEVGTQDKGER